MKRKSFRPARMSEVIREVASETILFQLRDPRIKGVTVTRTEVSGDLQRAKVFVSVLANEKETRLCLHALQHAAGYIQSKLADRLNTRFIPLIQFVLDEGIKKSIEISKLIQEGLSSVQNPESENRLENQDSESPNDLENSKVKVNSEENILS